jgi:hypothetical protein
MMYVDMLNKEETVPEMEPGRRCGGQYWSEKIRSDWTGRFNFYTDTDSVS